MDWGSFGLGIIGGITIKLAGDILSPTMGELGAKLHAKVWRKPAIRGQLAEDLKILDSITEPLLAINQIPGFPSTYKSAWPWLLEIDRKARKIRSEKFKDIVDKLIDFVGPMHNLNTNTPLHTILETWVKDDKAFKLVEEIRGIISEEIRGKMEKEKKPPEVA
jgi:hypothetical protein